MPYTVPEIVSADKAVEVIEDGMSLAVNTMAATSYPDALSLALHDRFEATGSPKRLKFWGATAQAMYQLDALSERIARCEGMWSAAYMGHWSTTPAFCKAVAENKIAGYNFPQGIISHMYRATASKKPIVTSRVGLKTFADPRFGGGKLNEMATEDWVEVTTVDGKEYLNYKTPKIDCCFIRATTADPMGNVTSEKEAAYVDNLSLAMATRASGGKVIVQVERVTDKKHYCKDITIPGVVIDYLVVDPDQKQTWIEPYNSAYSGETVMPANRIQDHMKDVLEKSGDYFAERQIQHYILARRAAAELKPGFVVNIGIGVPGLVPGIAAEMGLQDKIFMTNEAGTIGGSPAPAGSFGASLNPMYVTDMPTMFDFYDGGILDMVCVGAAQIDSKGNVNVGKIGPRVVGVGGFTNLTHGCKKIAFLTTFTDAKGLDVSYENKKLNIKSEGKIKKFVDGIDMISFSGEVGAEEEKDVIYVTERCVFRLTKQGLKLIEVAPGIDIQKDILDQMGYTPIVEDDVKIMDEDLFRI